MVDELAGEFAGKVALVTGGTRGIGRGVAEALAQRGCMVVSGYRADHDAARMLESVAAAAGWRLTTEQADVGVGESATALVNAVVARHGRLDILVNNAGIFPASPVIEISDDEWEAVLRSNLYSVFYCARAALPHMIEAGGGAMVNIASIAGKRGSALHAHYAAAKGGVLAFTRSLAKEAIADNIRVNAICPGRIATDMLLDVAKIDPGEYQRWLSEAPIHLLGTVEEVAAAVLFLVSDASSYIVGETLDVDGGHLMD